MSPHLSKSGGVATLSSHLGMLPETDDPSHLSPGVKIPTTPGQIEPSTHIQFGLLVHFKSVSL